MTINQTYRIITRSIAILGIFALGIVADRLYLAQPQNGGTFALRLQESDGYKFTRPLLVCRSGDTIESPAFNSLKEALSRLMEINQKNGTISNASIYYKDIITGRWSGINEDQRYAPASLLKVPIMIAAFLEAEQNPGFMDKTFYYNDTNISNVKPLISDPILKNGQTYTIAKLLEGMIIDSDNRAKDIIEAAINPEILKKTEEDLGIEMPLGKKTAEEESNYRISTKDYALFLRVLFNATYLTKTDSEKALELLSRAKFTKGLRAGIPENITISHKYGIRLVDEGNGKSHIELNNCGIIYPKTNPYLLCVITSGQDPNKMANFIADTASLVEKYTEGNNRN